MPSVVSLRTSANSSSVPIVVFVDMQQEYLAKPRLLAISRIDCALDKCRKVLDHSRRIGLPVAFIRMIDESAFFNRATPFVRWIEGFEPYRNEMIFERSSPSCYSSEAFTALVNQSRGGVVLAGFAGEQACLSTLIDAFHRNHKVTYLCARSDYRPVTHSTKCRRTMSTAPFRKYPEFMQKYLKQTIGSNRLYLASSVTEKTLVANSEERLHLILATLEQCRAGLIDSANRETAQLVSVAILELRMKLNRIADSELKALCDAMVPDDAAGGKVAGSEIAAWSAWPRRRPLLKLVK